MHKKRQWDFTVNIILLLAVNKRQRGIQTLPSTSHNMPTVIIIITCWVAKTFPVRVLGGAIHVSVTATGRFYTTERKRFRWRLTLGARVYFLFSQVASRPTVSELRGSAAKLGKHTWGGRTATLYQEGGCRVRVGVTIFNTPLVFFSCVFIPCNVRYFA